MKKFVKGLAALIILGALSFGTAEAAENPAAIENPFDSQELRAPWWYDPPPPPRHRRYDPPRHYRHDPPHFGRRPNNFEPPPPYRHMPPPRHRW